MDLSLRPRAMPSLRCAVCHDGAEGTVVCLGCGTLAHLECRQAGCPTLGCVVPSVTANPGLLYHVVDALVLALIVLSYFLGSVMVFGFVACVVVGLFP